MRGGAKGGDLVNGCCESKSWALSERDLNKFIMKDATMRCVLARSVASKTDTEGCISFTCIDCQSTIFGQDTRNLKTRFFFSDFAVLLKSAFALASRAWREAHESLERSADRRVGRR